MSSLPTPTEIDDKCAGLIKEVINQLERSFSEGIGRERDFPQALKAYKRLGDVLDKEAAIETALSIQNRMNLNAHTVDDDEPNLVRKKHICVFVDGSSNSYDALRWAVTHLIGTHDILHLVNIIPYQEFEKDAQHILQEGMDYAQGAGGIPIRHLQVKSLKAKDSSSSTSGVGESIKQYVEENHVDVVVIGSRGLGSIKRSLLGAVGLGSITDYAVTNLNCPVMVVKGQEAEIQSTGGGIS